MALTTVTLISCFIQEVLGGLAKTCPPLLRFVGVSVCVSERTLVGHSLFLRPYRISALIV